MMLMPKKEAIIQRREKIGMSQHELSLKAGLSGCALCRIEGGKSSSIHHLRAKQIAKVLGCKVDEIFTEIKKGA